MQTQISTLKKTFDKAEEKQRKMYNCLYDLKSIAGVLYLDEQFTNNETGKPKYRTQIGCCRVSIHGLRFAGSHN